MSLTPLFRTTVAAAMVGLALVNPAVAMTVQPVVLDLKPTGREASATIRVENSFTSPLPVELSVQSLDFDDSGVKPTGKDTGELVAFPLQALIQPGQTQSFRVQWVGDQRLAKSKHFYVTVAQLPVQLPDNQSAIQVLYDFQVLTNVASAVGKAQLSVAKTEIVMSATPANADAQKPDPSKTDAVKGAAPAAAAPKPPHPQPVIFLKNSGPNYGYLSQNVLRITQYDAQGKQIFNKTLQPQEIQQTVGFGLVGPEASRRFVLPVELPSAEGTIKAELSRAPAT